MQEEGEGGEGGWRKKVKKEGKGGGRKRRVEESEGGLRSGGGVRRARVEGSGLGEDGRERG